MTSSRKYFNLFLRERSSYNLVMSFVVGAYNPKQAYRLAYLAYKEIEGKSIPESVKIVCSPPAKRKSDLVPKDLKAPKGTFIIYKGKILDLSSAA